MEKRSFEENLGILESLVKDLENGNINLDDAISKYTEAMNIAKDRSMQINNATESVNKILNENGTLNDFNIKEGE